jgi:hypothetical protein
MIYLIIYLIVFVILTIIGLISGIKIYLNPLGHQKFPWYYEIYGCMILGLFSPLFLMIISAIQNHLEKK